MAKLTETKHLWLGIMLTGMNNGIETDVILLVECIKCAFIHLTPQKAEFHYDSQTCQAPDNVGNTVGNKRITANQLKQFKGHCMCADQ